VGHRSCRQISRKYVSINVPTNIHHELTRLVTVHGVDLYPPPATWVPPNCIFEVDDITQEWTWRNKFDLIHFRLLLGAFKPDEWTKLYRSCYECVPFCFNARLF
jgi:hypothetical protein